MTDPDRTWVMLRIPNGRRAISDTGQVRVTHSSVGEFTAECDELVERLCAGGVDVRHVGQGLDPTARGVEGVPGGTDNAWDVALGLLCHLEVKQVPECRQILADFVAAKGLRGVWLLRHDCRFAVPVYVGTVEPHDSVSQPEGPVQLAVRLSNLIVRADEPGMTTRRCLRRTLAAGQALVAGLEAMDATQVRFAGPGTELWEDGLTQLGVGPSEAHTYLVLATSRYENLTAARSMVRSTLVEHGFTMAWMMVHVGHPELIDEMPAL